MHTIASHTARTHAYREIFLDGFHVQLVEGCLVVRVDELVAVHSQRLVRPQPHQLERAAYALVARVQYALTRSNMITDDIHKTRAKKMKNFNRYYAELKISYQYM